MLSVSNLEQEIKRLKHQMNAVILGHYYQDSEIQDVADFVCDGLQLSQKAAAVSAEVIVFCGVLFMAGPRRFSIPISSYCDRTWQRVVHWQPAVPDFQKALDFVSHLGAIAEERGIIPTSC